MLMLTSGTGVEWPGGSGENLQNPRSSAKTDPDDGKRNERLVLHGVFHELSFTVASCAVDLRI